MIIFLIDLEVSQRPSTLPKTSKYQYSSFWDLGIWEFDPKCDLTNISTISLTSSQRQVVHSAVLYFKKQPFLDLNGGPLFEIKVATLLVILLMQIIVFADYHLIFVEKGLSQQNALPISSFLVLSWHNNIPPLIF